MNEDERFLYRETTARLTDALAAAEESIRQYARALEEVRVEVDRLREALERIRDHEFSNWGHSQTWVMATTALGPKEGS